MGEAKIRIKAGVQLREKELIKTAFAGGENREKALAALLQANYRIVLGYFLKLTQDPEAAKDLTQKQWSGHKNLRKYRGEGKFSSWLIAVGSNFYRDELQEEEDGRKNKGPVSFRHRKTAGSGDRGYKTGFAGTARRKTDPPHPEILL